MTLQQVSEWVKRTGGHDGRLQWWSIFAPTSPLYLKVAKPLLSIRTTGSITVERVAKPLKNKVMSKDRAGVTTGKAEVLLRAGINLRLLHKRKSQV